MILVDATIFSVYKYIDITVIFIASLLILWLSSISSDRLLGIILFLLSLLLITPYILWLLMWRFYTFGEFDVCVNMSITR